MPPSFRLGLLVMGAVSAVALSQVAVSAAPMTYEVILTGAGEVPPTPSRANGTAEITYDAATKKLTWMVTYSNLTGAPTAANLYGPAAAGATAPAEVKISGDLKSPIAGSATLTDAQAKDFMAGMMYFNVQTAANPGGEIRGQVDMSALFDPSSLGLQGE